jgi:hypothetical protein
MVLDVATTQSHDAEQREYALRLRQPREWVKPTERLIARTKSRFGKSVTRGLLSIVSATRRQPPSNR